MDGNYCASVLGIEGSDVYYVTPRARCALEPDLLLTADMLCTNLYDFDSESRSTGTGNPADQSQEAVSLIISATWQAEAE